MPNYAQRPRSVQSNDPTTAASAKAAARDGALADLATTLQGRPQAQMLRSMAQSLAPPLQRAPNRTGLPHGLKAGVESLSGLSLDAVRVHYNSAEPARFQAHATTQGHNIHIAAGQERHLPHEAWHVAQQMQGRVPATMQMHGLAVNDDAALEAEADRMGGQALQRQSWISHPPLRSSLLGTTAMMPVQRVIWDYLPSWNTTKTAAKSLLVGGAVGAGLALSGAVTLPAAIGLGLASAAATKVGGVGAGLGAGALGLGGVALGGLLGTVAGPIAGKVTSGILGTIGAGFGGTIGADVQSKLTPHPIVPGTRAAPTIGETMRIRAYEFAKAVLGPGVHVTNINQVINQLDDIPLQQHIRAAALITNPVNDVQVKYDGLAGIIDGYYTGTGQRAAIGAGNAVPAGTTTIVHTALLGNAFVQSILNGTALAPAVGQTLNFNGAPTQRPALAARDKFNALVQRPALPNVGPVASGWTDPVSYMGHNGSLTVGWGSTPDTLVHEFGHHLENNLEASEFGTLHNFLTARSVGPQLRKVGYGPLSNKDQTSEGYNANLPNPDVGGHSSLTRLGVDMIGNTFGSQASERSIDHFVQKNAHTPESSYATQVDAGDFKTEFLSTTIHYLADPQNARALIDTDPLRVCLFLHLARPAVYAQIQAVVDPQLLLLPPPNTLDALIHRLG